jgi:hypothetical protein
MSGGFHVCILPLFLEFYFIEMFAWSVRGFVVYYRNSHCSFSAIVDIVVSSIFIYFNSCLLP